MVSDPGCLMQCLVTHDETLGLCVLGSPRSRQRARAAGIAGPSSTWNAGGPSLRNLLGRVPLYALTVSWPPSGRAASRTPQQTIGRTTSPRGTATPQAAFGRPAIDRESS